MSHLAHDRVSRKRGKGICRAIVCSRKGLLVTKTIDLTQAILTYYDQPARLGLGRIPVPMAENLEITSGVDIIAQVGVLR